MNFKSLVILALYIPTSFLLSQDEEGSETAAEASVTGSASAPSIAAPAAVESNSFIAAARVMIAKGYTFNDLTTIGIDKITEIVTSGGEISDNLEVVTEASVKGEEVDTELLSKINEITNITKDIKAAVNSVANLDSYSKDTHQTGLVAAAKLASLYLQDKTLGTESALSPISVSDIVADNGYNAQFLTLLANYGAVGSGSGNTDNGLGNANSVLNALQFNLSSTLPSTSEMTLLDLVGELDEFAGLESGVQPYFNRTEADDTSLDSNGKTNAQNFESLASLPVNNIKVEVGSTLDFEAGASIDVGDYLSKANTNDVGKPLAEERKILVFGAMKDITIGGDLTFENTNQVEDHALVVAAADDLHFRSERKSGNADFASDVAPISIKYEGSNLAIASESELHLVNVNIETGGNLAIASLDNLTIQQHHSESFTVGNGGIDSDPDNIYLYASNQLNVEGLVFSGRVDDIYMDAKTIKIQNVDFPAASEVMLRSAQGGINTSGSVVPGKVNLFNVTHGAIPGGYINNDHFDTKDNGNMDSKINLGTGKPAIAIRSRL